MARDLRQVAGGQLLGDDRQHPVRRLGEHELTDVVEQRQAEETGPGADVDHPVASRASGTLARIASAASPARAIRSGVSQSFARSSNVAMWP